MQEQKNIAFIDGQNLYMGTAKREHDPWRIDLVRFRVYLEQKYGITKAHYFLGYVQEARQELYEDYKMLVDFLIEEKKFGKMLFPNRQFASSLYKKLGSEYFDYLELPGVRDKIGQKKEKGSLGN